MAEKGLYPKSGIPDVQKPRRIHHHRALVWPDHSILSGIGNLYGVARAVEAGSGIGCLPTYIAAKCENLVQILPEIESPHVRFYFIYPRQLKDSKRIEQLWTFLSQEARKEEASMGKVSL